MKRQSVFAAILGLAFTTACDKEEEASQGPEAGAARDAGAETVDSAVAAAEKVAGKVFDKELSKKACEILTPALVSKTFDLPEPELKQMKIMGCIYSWKAKDKASELSARFTTIMVHKTNAAATEWFSNATKSMTDAEAKAAMAEVTKKTQEHKSVDTKLKKKVAGDLGGLLAESVSGGVKYEKVSGIGDEAALNLSEGTLWIRVGNVSFVVGAYQGPPQPAPDLTGVGIKGMAAAAMKASKEWTKKTLPERKAASLKLGKVVVAALP